MSIWLVILFVLLTSAAWFVFASIMGTIIALTTRDGWDRLQTIVENQRFRDKWLTNMGLPMAIWLFFVLPLSLVLAIYRIINS